MAAAGRLDTNCCCCWAAIPFQRRSCRVPTCELNDPELRLQLVWCIAVWPPLDRCVVGVVGGVVAGDYYYYNDAAGPVRPVLPILRLSACCCKDALVDPW